MDTPRVIDHIAGWLRAYCEGAGLRGFAVGISGGIDSAVASALCARTGLPTLCVEMPIRQAPAHVARAQEHIGWLRSRFTAVTAERVPLDEALDAMERALPPGGDAGARELALANTRARLRMAALYYLAGLRGLLVAGTGNKVEDLGIGFFTKYGDGGVDLSPIGDLTKTEVRAVARELGIAASIVDAVPTDGLFGDERSDEAQIGASYPELEWAMGLREQGLDPAGVGLTPRQREVLAIFDRRRAANAHKLAMPPVCLVPPELKR